MTCKQAEDIPQAFTGYKLVSTSCNGIPVQSMKSVDYGLDPAMVNDDLRPRGTATVPTRPPPMGISHFQPREFDLFKVYARLVPVFNLLA